MKLWSRQFLDNQMLPETCSYRKGNKFPHLAWDGVPDGARSLAIIFENDTSKRLQVNLHWLVHAIPPTTREIHEGGPVLGVEVLNDFGFTGWGGPVPPLRKTNWYLFTLYALNVHALETPTKKTFRELCKTHQIVTAHLRCYYTQK